MKFSARLDWIGEECSGLLTAHFALLPELVQYEHGKAESVKIIDTSRDDGESWYSTKASRIAIVLSEGQAANLRSRVGRTYEFTLSEAQEKASEIRPSCLSCGQPLPENMVYRTSLNEAQEGA